MIRWPDELKKSLVQKQTVLYLGSGVSHNATDANGNHPKTWRSLIEYAMNSRGLSQNEKDVIQKYLDKDDLVFAGQLLKNMLGDDFYNFLESELNIRYNSAQIHDYLFNLDPLIVVTPNFDSIYDIYARSNDNTIAVYSYNKADSIVDNIRKLHRVIIKSHGSIEEVRDVIFSYSDYCNARTQYSLFYEVLDSLLTTKTFLFIGAGLNDPDIKMLLEDNKYKYQTLAKHFFVIPEDEIGEYEKTVYEETMGIHFLTFDKANNYVELMTSLQSLAQDVDNMANNSTSTL